MIRCWFGLAWQPVNCHEDSLPPPSPPPPPPSPPPPPPPSPPHSRHPKAKLCETLQVDKTLETDLKSYSYLHFSNMIMIWQTGGTSGPSLLQATLLNDQSGEGNFA